jgi:acylphosphatase
MGEGMERRAVRVIIRGRVQGVGYRWWAVGEARRLGIDGWVRNRGDGAVDLMAIGSAQAVKQMIEACGRGPAGAVVTGVEPTEAPDDGSVGFGERSTA